MTNSETVIVLQCEAPKGLTTNLKISLKSGPTGIIGESGAGKSTLARFLAGFESVAGQVRQLPDHIERIGMVFQHGALFDHLTVRGNLEFSFQLSRSKSVDFSSIVAALGVDTLLDQSITELSGGEKQRVAIARALLNEPDLLILDEAVSALDWRSRVTVLDWLFDYCNTHLIPVIMISHALDEIQRYCKQLILVDDLRATEIGEVTQTMNKVCPQFDLFSTLINAEVTTIRNDSIRETCVDGQLVYSAEPLPAGSTTQLKIFANQVVLSRQRDDENSMVNTIQVSIVDVIPLSETRIRVRLKLRDQFIYSDVSTWSFERLKLNIGESCFAQFKLL